MACLAGWLAWPRMLAVISDDMKMCASGDGKWWTQDVGGGV